MAKIRLVAAEEAGYVSTAQMLESTPGTEATLQERARTRTSATS